MQRPYFFEKNPLLKIPLKFPLLLNKKWDFKRVFKVGFIEKYGLSKKWVLLIVKRKNLKLLDGFRIFIQIILTTL